MARRKTSRRSGGRSFGGIMTKGVLPVSGIIGSALIGAGAATLAEKVVQVHPQQGIAVGFLTGGVGGAVGAAARDFLKGTTSTTSAGQW